ncbi:MAG: hypothetical protein KIS78_01975 [Labilithrix sp.]|nr:hypothetical protein [Labilithrix sp.]MCW5831208.1 hypothetical protein [Labilithrix sp.]
MRRVLFVRSVLTALVMTSIARPADADDEAPPSIALSYEIASSPSACPSEQDFGREVERLLGVDPFRADAPFRVRVEIREDAKRGREGRVVFSGASTDDPDLPWGGEQTIRSSDCGELASTLALVITVAIERLRRARPQHAGAADPDGAAPPAPTSTLARPAAPPPPAQSSTAAGRRNRAPSTRRPGPSPATRPPPSPRVHLSSVAGAVAAVNMTPGASAGTAFGARVRLGAASAGLEGVLLAPSTVTSIHGGGVAVSLRAAEITACWHVGWGERLDLRACPVVAPLLLRGVGQSLPLARMGSATSIALGGRLGAGVEVLGPIRFELEVEALGPLTQNVFAVDQETVWAQPSLGAMARANVAVRFR